MKCEVDERGWGTVDVIQYAVGQYALAHTGGYCTINGTDSPVDLIRE